MPAKETLMTISMWWQAYNTAGLRQLLNSCNNQIISSSFTELLCQCLQSKYSLFPLLHRNYLLKNQGIVASGVCGHIT